MKHKIRHALASLRPDAQYRITGTVISWKDSTYSRPTDDEINAEITRLDNQYAADEYKRKRAAEYPSVVDQLDDIYHNGIDGWKTTIKATKDKYPKP